MQYVRQEEYNKIELVLSKERLGGYTTKNKQGSDLLTLYEWNTKLSESLYPLLQMIEVIFRNSVYSAVAEHFNDLNWLQNDQLLAHVDFVEVKKQELHLRRKLTTITVGRIISSLNFGFWTGLLDSRYEMIFWRSKIIKRAFPNMEPKGRTRHKLSKHFNGIRKLRNRIFHYDPIWHLPDLKMQHDNILQAISWIEPATLQLLPTDRFYKIYNAGPEKNIL